MDGVVDLAESRKAKSEKSEQFRDAARDLLILLERQRHHISEEFMTFLIAMAVSDQALHYANTAGHQNAGHQFLNNLITTARQLFEAHDPGAGKADHPKSRPDEHAGRVLPFTGDPTDKSVE
jgi:hypothetical protein